MHKLFLLLISSIFLLLAGCAQQGTTPSFEEAHNQDMQKKELQEAAVSGEVVTTIDLLTPKDPLPIVESMVAYASGINGFYAEPENDSGAAAVILIHERWGLNEHIKDMARIMAMNGYKALAVDLYKGQVASDMDTAKTLSSSLNQEEATTNLLAAEAYLRTKTEKVASLGRCLGGKQSLELSLASDTLDATIIYYGRLTGNVEILSNMNEPILGIFAENDGGIPPSAVADFQQGLEAAGKIGFNLKIYSGANHAFANPTGNAFNKDAALDAWGKTLEFLKTNLQ